MKPAALLPLLLLLPAHADDPVVVRGKDVEFTRSQYGDWLLQRMGIQYLDDFAFSKLVVRLAEERGLAPTDADLEVAYEEEFQRVTDTGKTGDLASFTADLARNGYSVETWKARRLLELRSDLAQNRIALADRVVTDEQMRTRFKDLFGELGERVNLEVFFFSAFRNLDPADANPDVGALKAAARERAVAALEQLKAGADQATIMALSDPVTSRFVQDGLITGYRRLMLGTEVERAVASLDDPGDTSLPIDVFDGTYVLRLVAREPVRMEDVKDELVAAVLAEEVTGSELAAVRELVTRTYAVEKLMR